ncbi:MAG: hypothetical protein HQ518_15685 [Rhodopirellula sp.]|nr:hypothetical protein [Rhodopirellula sp.]
MSEKTEVKKTETGKFPLSQVVNQLRSELKELQKTAQEHELQFSLEGVEVELQVGLSAEIGGKIGFNCWIYQAEVSPNAKRENVQTIRLTLKPEKEVKLSRKKLGGKR